MWIVHSVCRSSSRKWPRTSTSISTETNCTCRWLFIPFAPTPKTRAGFSSLSARVNFAADTIFILLVIFWMFLTLLRRIETGGEVQREDRQGWQHKQTQNHTNSPYFLWAWPCHGPVACNNNKGSCQLMSNSFMKKGPCLPDRLEGRPQGSLKNRRHFFLLLFERMRTRFSCHCDCVQCVSCTHPTPAAHAPVGSICDRRGRPGAWSVIDQK